MCLSIYLKKTLVKKIFLLFLLTLEKIASKRINFMASYSVFAINCEISTITKKYGWSVIFTIIESIFMNMLEIVIVRE